MTEWHASDTSMTVVSWLRAFATLQQRQLTAESISGHPNDGSLDILQSQIQTKRTPHINFNVNVTLRSAPFTYDYPSCAVTRDGEPVSPHKSDRLPYLRALRSARARRWHVNTSGWVRGVITTRFSVKQQIDTCV